MRPLPAHRRRLRPAATWLALLLVAGSALAACGAADDLDGASTTGAGAEALVADGAEVYTANCAVCHGDDATGTQQGPPLAHIIYEPGHHSDESFRTAIARGVTPHHWNFGPMPPLRLDADEVDAVIAYVRSVQREAGIID